MGHDKTTKYSHTPDSSTEFSAPVRALSHKGHGVVTHPDGRVFFVKGTWPGEEGTYRIHPKAKSYDNAELVSLQVRSPDRIEAPCPHVGTCGGCPWMMMSPEAQVAAKEQRISFLLDKNDIEVGKRHPLIQSKQTFGYRNRAQFKTDGQALGYMMEGTNELAPIDDCLILNDSMRGMLKSLRARLPSKEWRPTGRHPFNFLDIDDQQSIEQIELNRRRPFRQGNTSQNENMRAWIVDALKNVSRDAPIMEAFCGSGNFTEVISQAGFKNVVAAEVRGSAIQELRAKNLPGVRILEIDMNQKDVWQQLGKMQPETKVLLVDPPREGMEERLGLFKHLPKLETILYISCEPTTWSRDLKDFQLNGWKVAHLTPLDMFPHTPHVELLSVLTR